MISFLIHQQEIKFGDSPESFRCLPFVSKFAEVWENREEQICIYIKGDTTNIQGPGTVSNLGEFTPVMGLFKFLGLFRQCLGNA